MCVLGREGAQGRTVGRAAEEPDKAKDERRYETARGGAKSAFPHTLRDAR